MSRTGDDAKASENGKTPDQVALKSLEEAVGRALQRVEELTARAADAEARSSELAEIVRRFTGDKTAADRLLTRLQKLETENVDLRSRVERGREGVERLLARVRFLEDQK